DDILTTWLMNITYEGNASTILPKMQMEHYPLQLIRPLCLVEESWISEVARLLGFEHQKTFCPYEDLTRRRDMNNIFHQLEVLNPEARYSMWHAIQRSHSSL
ncbi:MAG: tRNA 2-thiocytidine(32) synthetase TtcA, partial [Bacteroidaceae bacterium]|nr:tRNA 2-thiocytidine(32) synthetase TtcA [Bacteroidaceae bacterium]